MKHLKGAGNVLLNSEHFWDHMTYSVVDNVYVCVLHSLVS